jgi:hypothetical protein
VSPIGDTLANGKSAGGGSGVAAIVAAPPAGSVEMPVQASGVVPVKAHTRGAAAGADKPKVLLTLQVLVNEYSVDQQNTTARVIRLGKLSDSWICLQPEFPELRLDRSSAVTAIARALQEAKIDRAPVNRNIRCFHVARLFGGKAHHLSFSALREFQVFIKRDRESEIWNLVPSTAAAAKALWQRALEHRLSGDAVRREVLQILPAKNVPIRKKKIRMAMVMAAVRSMSVDQRRVVTRLLEQLDAKQPAAA